MPFFKVSLNDHEIAVAGGQDVAVITLSLVGTKGNGEFWLSLSGMRRGSFGVNSHFNWIERSIREGDILRITPMVSVIAASVPTVEAKQGAKIIANGKPEMPKDLHLEVRLPDGREVKAGMESEEVLQAVLGWHSGAPASKLEVDSVTSEPSGYTKGKRWVEESILPSQAVEIAIVAGP